MTGAEGWYDPEGDTVRERKDLVRRVRLGETICQIQERSSYPNDDPGFESDIVLLVVLRDVAATLHLATRSVLNIS